MAHAARREQVTMAIMIEPDTIVIEADDQLALRCGAVLIWTTTAPLEHAPLAPLREALERMIEDQPQGVALLLVALGEGELPKLSTRRRIVRGLSSLGGRLQAVAATFEGDRSWLALARAGVEGLFAQVEETLGGDRFPMRVFNDRVDAVVWLQEVVVGPDLRPIETGSVALLVDEACARVSAAGRARAADLTADKSE